MKKSVDPISYQKLKHILNDNKLPFEQFSTEKRRLKVLKKESIYIDPVEFKIGEEKIKHLLSNGDFIVEL